MAREHVQNCQDSCSQGRATNNNTASVPQIFIKQKYIGGAEDLADMFTDDRLATM